MHPIYVVKLRAPLAALLVVSLGGFTARVRPDLSRVAPRLPSTTTSRCERTVVHLVADAPVILERREPDEWVTACSAPCDTSVPVAGSYRVRGSNVRSSSPFSLSASAGARVVLDVRSAPRGPVFGGVVATSVGGGSVVVGGIVLALNWLFGALSCSGGSDPAYAHSCGPSDGGNDAGYVLIGAGAATLIAGVVVLATAPRTTVRESAADVAPRQDAWLRLPQWREDKAGAGQRPLAMPLFQATF